MISNNNNTASEIKRQIQEEVSRVLMNIADDVQSDDNDDVDVDKIEDYADELTNQYNEEEETLIANDPFDDPVMTWTDGGGQESSIELNLDNMEHMKKYYFMFRGQEYYIQKKSIETNKFEIGIFPNEQE